MLDNNRLVHAHLIVRIDDAWWHACIPIDPHYCSVFSCRLVTEIPGTTGATFGEPSAPCLNLSLPLSSRQPYTY